MLHMKTVSELMTPKPVTISSDTSITDAHRLMKDKNIRRLPVMKDGRLVGIVTIGDIREAEPSAATSLSIWELHYLISKLMVKDVMTKNPLTVTPETSVGTAARIMLENKVSGLPVVSSNGQLVGIITESDIFRMVAQSVEPTTA